MSGSNQPIHFCKTPDNTKIAYIQTGEGLPILKTGNWLTDISTDLENFLWKHFFGEFSKNAVFSVLKRFSNPDFAILDQLFSGIFPANHFTCGFPD